MPSLAANALARGFHVLLATNGESLTLVRASGNVAVRGVVDRHVQRGARKLEIDFDAERASLIEIQHSAVAPLPREGESLKDAFSKHHRIVRVLPLDGLVCRMRCETD